MAAYRQAENIEAGLFEVLETLDEYEERRGALGRVPRYTEMPADMLYMFEGPVGLPESQWKVLADISMSGFIIDRIGDAANPITGKPRSWRRSYAEGLVPKVMTRSFIDKVNLFSPGIVAYQIAILGHGSLSIKGVKAGVGVKASYNEERKEFFTSGGYQVQTTEYFKGIATRFNVNHKFVNMVGVIDTQWGRSAMSRKGLYQALLSALTSDFPLLENVERLDKDRLTHLNPEDTLDRRDRPSEEIIRIMRTMSERKKEHQKKFYACARLQKS